MTPGKPEEIAREQIDAQLASSGWVVQDMADLNLQQPQGSGAGVPHGQGVRLRRLPPLR